MLEAQQSNGTVNANGTVYDDRTLIQLLRAELAQSDAAFEVMRKRAYDAGLDTSLTPGDQKEVQRLTEIKMDAYPVYLAEPNHERR